MNLICAEARKLAHNTIFWVFAAAMILVGIWFSGISFGKLPAMLTAETPQYDTGVETARGEYVFWRSMGDSSFTAWLSILFTALFVGADFVNRTMNELIYTGHSRLSIFIVKMVQLYLVACAISFLYPMIATLRYGRDWLSTLDVQEVRRILRALGLRMLLDMAMMSVSIVVTFLLRDFLRPLGVVLVFTVALSQALGLRHNLAEDSALRAALELYPAFQYQKVMLAAPDRAAVTTCILSSLSGVGCTLLVSWLIFRRADLP